MGLGSIDTLYPHVRIEPLAGIADLTSDVLEQRLLHFEFIDRPKEFKKIILQFDNSDGKIVNMATLILGLRLKISWGYQNVRSKSYVVFIKKIKGALARSPSTISPAGSSIGVIDMEGTAYPPTMHSDPEKDLGTFYNVNMGQVARQIARKIGYTERQIFVQEEDNLGNPLPKIDEVQIPDDYTYTTFLVAKAAEYGFVFDASNKEFHWHDEEYKDAELEEIEYFMGPDLLDISIEGDYRFHLKKVTAASLDISKRVKYLVSAEDTRVGVAVRGRRKGVVDRKALEKRDIVRTISEKTKQKAVRRLLNHSRRKWKINMTLVGNPNIARRKVLKLVNFDPIIDGQWYIKGCTHTLDDSGYTTTLELRGKRAKGPDKVRIKYLVDAVSGRIGVARIAYRDKTKKLKKGKKGKNRFKKRKMITK